MKSFFAKLKPKRKYHIDPLSRSDRINLSWLIVVSCTLLGLLSVLWYALGEFKYWSDIESHVTVTPPSVVRYNQQGADDVIQRYEARAQQLITVQEMVVDVVEPEIISNDQSVRAGQ